MKITKDELRRVLFNIENQDMTIAELRRVLFEQDDREILEDEDITK